MKMYPEKQTILQKAVPYVGSLALTAVIFIALPLSQWASDTKVTANENSSTVVAISPPPPPTPQIEAPVEDVVEEEIEMKQELQKLSLDQIDLSLNAGSGGMTGAGFRSDNFQLSDNFANDLIFEVADLDEQPRPLVRIAPAYPSTLKRVGIQGRVWLVFIVDEQGRTGNARVLKTTHPDFSESAVEAVLKWKFEPGKKDGKAVKTRVRIPLSFSLRR